MVTGANNNKYYEMVYNGGNTFTVNYGRVDSTKITETKPIGKWDSIYKEKTRKGYKDVSDMVSTKVEVKKDDTDIVEVKQTSLTLSDKFLNLMKSYTDNLVKKTYSVKFENVTELQVETAQKLIDKLTKINRKDTQLINDTLLELYTIIPRYMGKVQQHLLPNIDLDKTFVQEQDNLDAMASQVKMYKEKPSKTKKAKKEAKTLMDILGIKMKEVSNVKELEYLIKQCSERKIESVFKVEKSVEDEIFENWMSKQKNKETRYLIHGTRCTSVIPILEQGLKIRPTGNFQFSGKAYGDGNYFSEVVNKSLGYTGYDNDKILLVYEVHTGNPFVYEGWYRGNSFTLNYTELSKRGFDSTHVNAGNGLLNSEIIVYNEEQCSIKYIIWLKN
jgi:poly [ADP-ribose] polymerase